LYTLIHPDGRVVSGNIDGVPIDLSRVPKPDTQIGPDLQKAISNAFSYERPELETGRVVKRRARGLFLAGPDGYGLFVARDLGPGVEVADQVAQVIWVGGAAVLAFALTGGFFASRQAASRVDELTRTTRAVMAGDLTQRAAVRTLRPGEGDEFDALTHDLNAMLERIDNLVRAARTTGDSIAHDLRSPLTRLRARLETALATAKGEEELRGHLDDSLGQLDDIVATFNAVLRLSRLEAGVGGQMARLDISGLVAQLGEMFEPVIEDKGLTYREAIEPDLMILADASLLSQAISNLLDNAVKYTATGHIELGVKRLSQNEVEICVSDTGMGIPAEQRAFAMGRFARLDAARSLPGSGLGLSLALAVADLHKGRLVLADGDAGSGLRASLIVPSQV
ncbi:MAG: hypothetical protein RLZZ157_899, partial [Pseudomonadota bacterium]